MQHRMKLARDGDPSSIQAVVESLRPRISTLARYYGRVTGEDPDDLIQEAWVGLLEAIPKLNLQIGSPEQWLIACARWRLLDAVKRSRVRRCVPLEEIAECACLHTAETALSHACVSEFIGGLKTVQRDALRHLLAGLTWREAGKAMGCTSANIAYHVKQIKRKYREWSGE